MNYYLDVFAPHTWNDFREHGNTVSVFAEKAKTHVAESKAVWAIETVRLHNEGVDPTLIQP
jgi:hypothetical protein